MCFVEDSFYVVWQSKKITIPFREEITKGNCFVCFLHFVCVYSVTWCHVIESVKTCNVVFVDGQRHFIKCVEA